MSDGYSFHLTLHFLFSSAEALTLFFSGPVNTKSSSLLITLRRRLDHILFRCAFSLLPFPFSFPASTPTHTHRYSETSWTDRDIKSNIRSRTMDTHALIRMVAKSAFSESLSSWVSTAIFSLSCVGSTFRKYKCDTLEQERKRMRCSSHKKKDYKVWRKILCKQVLMRREFPWMTRLTFLLNASVRVRIPRR